MHSFKRKERPQKNLNFEYVIDTLAIVAGLSQTIIWSPQIIKIFQTKNVESISAISIGMIWFTSLIWFTYAIYHKEKPLIISSSSVSICTTIILISIAIYK